MTTVSHINERGTRAFTTGRQADGDRLFEAAKRHSRRVRLMRVALPVGIVLASLVTIVVTTWLDPLRALKKLPLDIGGLVVSGTKITMQQPRLAGFTRDSRPYEVTARAAAQDVTKPEMVELQDIHATMEMPDLGLVKLSARNGVYDTKRERLTLRQDIVIVSSNGYKGRLSEALVDVRNGHIVSDKPVELTMLKGTVNANKLEVVDSGNLVRFDKGVTVILTLDSDVGRADEKKETP